MIHEVKNLIHQYTMKRVRDVMKMKPNEFSKKINNNKEEDCLYRS